MLGVSDFRSRTPRICTPPESPVNVTDLTNHVAAEANVSKTAARRAVLAVFEGITNALAREDDVRIPNFGSFRVKRTVAGTRNAFGTQIKVAASRKVRFSVGKGLKETVAA